MPRNELAVSLVLGASLDKGFGKVFSSTDDRLKKLRGGIKTAQDQARRIEAFKQLQIGLGEAQAAARKAQDRVVSLGAAMRQASAPTKKMRAEMARAHQEVYRTTKRVDEQRRVLNEHRLAMKRAGQSTVNLEAQEKRLGRTVEELRRRYDRLDSSMARSAARKKRREELKTRGYGMLGAVYGAGRVLGETFGIEEQTIRLETVINAEDGDAEAAVRRSVRHAREVARRTLASEAELLNIQYELNSAGLTEAAARVGSEVASKVATVTKGDVGQVAKITGTVFNNLGDSIAGANVEEKIGRIGNVLTKTQFKFAISDFGQLGDGLAEGAASAKANRLPLEQFAASLGVLNTAGMEGSRAGTALSAVMRQMGKASADLGFSIVRSADGSLDLVSTMAGLRRSLEVFDDLDERNQVIQELFGDEGLRGVIPLMEGLESFRKGTAEVSDSTGLVVDSYQKFLDTGGGQWKMLTQNATALGTALGQTLLPTLNWVVGGLAKAAGLLGELVEKVPALGHALGAVATAGLVAFGAEYATGGGLGRLFGRGKLAGAAPASQGLTSVAHAATQAAAALRGIAGGGPLGGTLAGGGKGKAGARGLAGRAGGLRGRIGGLAGRAGGFIKGLPGMLSAKGLGGRALGLVKGKAGLLGAGIAALSVGSTLLDDDLSGAEKAKGVSRDVGAVGGALAGAKLGALLGSVVPGAGTVVGGILGSIAGGILGGIGGGKLGGLFGRKEPKPELATAGVEAASTPLGGLSGGISGDVDNRLHVEQLTIQQQPGEDGAALAERFLQEMERRRRLAGRGALRDEL